MCHLYFFTRHYKKISILLILTIICLFAAPVKAEFDPWPVIKQELFKSRAIIQDQNFVSLFIPDTVEDAAMVPVKIRLAANAVANAQQLYLIIDRNPDPYAMQVEFKRAYTDKYEIGERLISTRVRLNEFSRVRAILETNDGNLFMSEKFALGSGGCSAPPATDPQQALNNLGEIRFKTRRNDDIHKDWNETIIMIRHPNFSGMQPGTGKDSEIIPANYIEKVEVMQDEDPLLVIHSGISISENPVFRFSYGLNSDQVFSVKVADSENNIYEKEVLITHGNK
ncbi:MAG: quinoprotein dehydrogenase-associated SoxYZ-like carrier [Proteobacteria bacterium]|nr:quinoprotein dehydrogenase-associated SoxYZ-like carrier [Pseudomonadota bacterium]